LNFEPKPFAFGAGPPQGWLGHSVASAAEWPISTEYLEQTHVQILQRVPKEFEIDPEQARR